MTKAIATAAALWMLTFSPVMFAQQAATVGELIDKGGKKLAREELVKLLSGATVRGISLLNPRLKLETTYKSDGTIEGLAVTDGVGRGNQFFGKWSVSEQGEICADLNSSRAQIGQSCTPYFALGGTYYQALKDEKSAPVYEREIKR